MRRDSDMEAAVCYFLALIAVILIGLFCAAIRAFT